MKIELIRLKSYLDMHIMYICVCEKRFRSHSVNFKRDILFKNTLVIFNKTTSHRQAGESPIDDVGSKELINSLKIRGGKGGLLVT